MLPGLKEGWELAPQYFCTPLPCWKKHAKAFFDRNTQKKVSFFMSRRNACYQSEEIAPVQPPHSTDTDQNHLTLETSAGGGRHQTPGTADQGLHQLGDYQGRPFQGCTS